MNANVLACLLCLLILPGWPLYGQENKQIEVVVLHPIMNDTFVCAEHAEGELTNLGDAFGKDCLVIRMDTARAEGRRLPGLFQRDGLKNEDWFGWEVPLLAPCDGVIASIATNPMINQPGDIPDRDDLKPASEIRFSCTDDVQVVYAHVRDIQVQAGDSVRAGDMVAEIGNNAVSSAPHIHVGAWRNDTPLQIRFDLGVLGRLRSGK